MGGCVLIAGMEIALSIGSIVDAGTASATFHRKGIQMGHTNAATLKMLLSDLSEPDPGNKFVCCKLMEVEMCCFCTRGGTLVPKLGRAYFRA